MSSGAGGKIIIGLKPKKKPNAAVVKVISKKTAAGSPITAHDDDDASAVVVVVGAPSMRPPRQSDRPSSPNTVVNTHAEGGGGGTAHGGDHNRPRMIPPKKKKATTGRMITIQPFERPPQIPQRFYDDSLDVLRRAMRCVLRHEALTADYYDAMATRCDGGGEEEGEGVGSGLIGREELYRSVEDLCHHKFGNRLYADVVTSVYGASGEVVCRLLAEKGGEDGDGDVPALRIDDSMVGYDAVILTSELNLKDGGGGRLGNGTHHPSSSSSGGGSANEGRNAPSGGNDGASSPSSSKNKASSSSSSESSPAQKRYELLRRMDDVFRVTFIHEYLNFVRSIFTRLDRACVYFSDKELDEIIGVGGKEGPPAGKVVDRSSVSSQNSRTWGLLEVGLACLRKHMTRVPDTFSNATTTTTTTPVKTLPVLTALVLTTAYAILSEYDNNDDDSSLGNNRTIDDTRPLVRNCVRTCIDLGALTQLLEELIVGASIRFQKEGQWWGNALSESKRTAPEFLQHVESRLKQSLALTSCYIPSTPSAAAALRQLSQRRRLTSAAPTDESSLPSMDITWPPINNNSRRIFPAIIESQLLTPHLASDGILHPRHLYPMLDDGDGSSSTNAGWKVNTGSKTYLNAMRLYGLCWRLTQASSAPSPSKSSFPSPQNKRNSASSSTSTQQTALLALRVAFGEYGRLRGSEITRQGVSDSNNGNVKDGKEMEKKVVPDLLSFKSHLESLHSIAFRSDESLGTMVRSILEDVMNEATSQHAHGDGGRRTAELLAKHVDGRFRDAKAGSSAVPVTKGALTADANEAFQNEVLALFRHNQSKDVFEAFYKRDLAKRLLTGRSVSYDMERSFLSKLKAECGTAYTSKMEGMFKDMEMSRDIMSSYAAYASGATNATVLSTPAKAVEMEVQVLTTGYWPVYPKYPNIILPQELILQRDMFESYYKDKYQGRRIAWQYSLGHCIVKASFPKEKGPKELNVNVCQTLVLLCFQYGDGPDGRGLTLDDIMKKTGIDDRAELERVLQSLSLGRDGTRVLKKVDYDDAPVNANESPKKKQKIRRNIGENDRFTFNSSFTNNQRRIRITNITMKETVKERSDTHEAVSNDRLYLIDAAVVRIMKARKTLEHRTLMGEVMTQLKFPASSSDIKKRIETLIEREYMERIEGDRSKYKYLA